jgi:enediyne biosynthesis protein E4
MAVNNDGLLDLFNSRFDEVAFETGVALPEHGNLISGMGVDFRDLNNDGKPDIVVVALDSETFPVYENNGKGGFTEITGRSGMTLLSNPMSGYSPNIADFDNDGWKDFFVSRGDVQSPAMAGHRVIDQPNTVFRNLFGKHWEALTAEAGFDAQPARRHCGSAYGDFNHDGKLDLVVTGLSAPAELWMNDSTGGNHWLDIAPQGTKSNRDGIGARIRVLAGGQSQYNLMSTASGYASSSAGTGPFWLGKSGEGR